jgi:L-threonylcarbamoyladenylate synthase
MPSIVQGTAAGIAAAADVLRRGNLVVFPTETVYGLGADARNDHAIAKVFAAKRRPHFNPLIVHVADLAAAEDIAIFNPHALVLAERFWPGPLTLVLPRKGSGISLLATAGLDTVAVRVPAHPVALALLKAFDGPVAAPSANLSGQVSPTRAEHAAEGLAGVAMILDGGPCTVGVESTIAGFEGGRAVLLRSGGVPRSSIEAVTGTLVQTSPTGRPSAPGQLASHYAPRARVRLNAQAPLPHEAFLAFGPNAAPGANPTLNLSPSGDLTEAAANLFAYLRALDASRASAIAVMPIPTDGLGEAINDRLARAAAPRETAAP